MDSSRSHITAAKATARKIMNSRVQRQSWDSSRSRFPGGRPGAELRSGAIIDLLTKKPSYSIAHDRPAHVKTLVPKGDDRSSAPMLGVFFPKRAGIRFSTLARDMHHSVQRGKLLTSCLADQGSEELRPVCPGMRFVVRRAATLSVAHAL